jgi:hypothetical protein
MERVLLPADGFELRISNELFGRYGAVCGIGKLVKRPNSGKRMDQVKPKINSIFMFSEQGTAPIMDMAFTYRQP